MTINPKAAAWLETRAIDLETALRMGIYSARRVEAGEPVQDARGDILVFPYFEGGQEVNAKYRAAGKRFWQRAGARKTFFNADVLDDPALEAGQYAAVITEGEMDTLAVIQAGYPFAVSVPDGAPPARDDQGNLIAVPDDANDIVPEQDDKYRYVANNWNRLSRIKRFVLATDGDEAGQRLSLELARRLGRSRCSFITYPPEPKVADPKTGEVRPCKDLDEVLIHFGQAAVLDCITRAKPFPVRGLYRLSEFPDLPPIATLTTGFPRLNPSPDRKEPHLTLYRGAFVVVSGLPGSGKTAWTMQLAFNMARLHGWRIVVASFEMHVAPTLRDMLQAFFIWKPRREWTSTEVRVAREFIEAHFAFIALDPRDDETEADVDWVLDRASDSVIRNGSDMLIVDPWNEVEHKRRPGENVADYTNSAIRKFKRFARSYDVCTMVVAHPTKAAALSAKNGDPVSLYDISDGATWANKAELGVIVHRKSPADLITEIGIKKVKFRGTGRVGEVYLNYAEDIEAFVD
ncbi:AAA family ATPase [Enterovirga aerilata]|uniref:AAA family ATPase n=1 Tax=Enterovirga aerilata TaxID=2730920 RepID=A0A849IFV5_9HYPH|nr:AAA family ATPase [Enterovirga sp. DB1703]NNM75040.1 AAA family ATPase [Enterovirga sp. DB1703]